MNTPIVSQNFNINISDMVENIMNDDDRQYLMMMQENITRMATNSANCKTWMTTIVSAFFALGCSINELNGWILFSFIPVLIFWYLDTFYLQMERKLRNRELDFLIIVKEGLRDNRYTDALYNFSPLKLDSITDEQKAKGFVQTNNRWFSKSIAPFYGGVLAAILAISVVLNFNDLKDMIQCVIDNIN